MPRFRLFSSTLAILIFVAGNTYAASPTTADPNQGGPTPDIHDGKSDATKQPKEKLAFLLSGYEYFPKRDDLDKIAPATQVEAMLIDFVLNGKEPMQRIRAVDALGYYQSEQVIGFLNQLAHKRIETLPPRLADSFQHRGIVALSKAIRADALPYIEDLLSSSDLQIQLTAVNAIGKNCGKAGRAVLKNVLQNNPDPLVVVEMKRFL